MTCVTDRRRSRPAWQAGGFGAELLQGSDSTDTPDVACGDAVARKLADLWSYTGSGARAGRGFHYQDAVGAWLAGLILTQEVPVEKLVPEGLDDLSCEGGHAWQVQVKSRQERLGDFSEVEAAGHILHSWVANQERRKLLPDVRLAVVFERPVAGESFGEWGQPIREVLASDHSFLAVLTSAARCRGLAKQDVAELIVSTSVMVLDWQEALLRTTVAVKTQTNLPLGAADQVVLALTSAVGACADENAERGWDTRSGLTRTDLALLVSRTVELIDHSGLQEAESAGICEPVDRASVLPTEGFYEGRDVEPGHVAAGLVQPRPDVTDQVVTGLARSSAVLVTGPSGVGKSAVVWMSAYAMPHVLWYRLWRLRPDDVQPLLRLARVMGAGPRTLVGFIVDGVGRGEMQAWDSLRRRISAIPGVYVVGSVRTEDLLPLRTLPECVTVPVSLDESVAERIYAGLVASGATTRPHWREAFDDASGLTLEFTYLLTQGHRLTDVIRDQVQARLTDPSRQFELEVLAVASVAHRWGARVPVNRLCEYLGVSNPELHRALQRLDDEHLVQVRDHQVTGLHELRSTAVVEAIHAAGAPSLADSAVVVIGLVDAGLLRPFVAGLLVDHPDLDSTIVQRLSDRLSHQPDTGILTDMLQALRLVDVYRRAMGWTKILARHEIVPADQLLTIRFGLWKTELPQGVKPEIAAAIAEIRTTDCADSPLRDGLLLRMRTDTVTSALATCTRIEHVRRLLGALRQAPPAVANGIACAEPARVALVEALGDATLHDVATVLSAARDISPRLARGLVDLLGGEDAMLLRLWSHYPWATEVRVSDTDDRRICVLRLLHISEDAVPDPAAEAHDAGSLLLRCLPDCDAVDVKTLYPGGVDFRVAGISIGVSQLARAVDHGPTTVAWNRAVLRLAARVVGTTDTTSWMHRVQNLLTAARQVTDDLICVWCRSDGKPGDLARLEEQRTHLSQEACTVPALVGRYTLGVEEVDDEGALPEPDPFYRLMRRLVENLPGRLADPGEWGSLVGLVGGTLLAAAVELRDAPWEFVGLNAPPEDLEALITILRNLRDVLATLAGGNLSGGAVIAAARDGAPERSLRRVAAVARASMATRRQRVIEALEQKIGQTKLHVQLLSRSVVSDESTYQLPHRFAILVRLDRIWDWAAAMEALQPILSCHTQDFGSHHVLVVPSREGRPLRQLARRFLNEWFPEVGLFDQWADSFATPHLTPLTDAFDRAHDAIYHLSGLADLQRHRELTHDPASLLDSASQGCDQALEEIDRLSEPDSVVAAVLSYLAELRARVHHELDDHADDHAGPYASAIATGVTGGTTTEFATLNVARLVVLEWDINRRQAQQLLHDLTK
jgi:hypothetical protein